MNKPASKPLNKPGQQPKPLVGPPVVPRDAASLMLLRMSGGKVEVLMGQRHTRSPFMPDIYVFPGGKIESDDWLMPPASNLDPAVSAALRATAKCSLSKAAALANAAIRETWEEVGLMLATKTPRPGVSGVWSDFTSAGLAPNHDGLRMIGRAITPTVSPQRFHARFLAAEADLTVGELRESHELEDLGFRTIEEALSLPVIDVTEEMLKRVGDLSREGLGFLRQPQQKIVFASYRNQRPQVRLV